VATLAVFSIFTCIILASKKMWSAVVIMTFTQLPALYLFHRCGGRARRAGWLVDVVGCWELAGGRGCCDAMRFGLQAGW
jgi:hypothetical protein